MGKELMTVEQLMRVVDDTKNFDIEYYINGDGLTDGCVCVACSSCCFHRLHDIESCFHIMSKLSGKDIHRASSVKYFAKYLAEELKGFWRL